MGDLMTAYNGAAITYDEIGNPLSDGRWTYQWQHGRQLAAMISSNGMWYYSYDADGMRTQRTNNITTYSYVYNGGLLSQMTKGSDVLRFIYDASGSPMILEYGNERYYFVTNMQGDVVAILNAVGAKVVEYRYDAWGNIFSTTGSMASTLGYLNPLRYRGYVYDQETGLYYLQSRYYNPQWGRFLNADAFAATGQGLTGNNVFAYCGNNPIARKDEGGKFWNIVIGAAVGAAIGAVTTALDSYYSTGSVDWGHVAISAVVGGVSGGVAATGLGVFVQAGISAGACFIGSLASDGYDAYKTYKETGKTPTMEDAGKAILRATGEAAVGFGASVIGTGAGKVVSKGVDNMGTNMLLRSKGTTYLTRAQAKNMAKQGKALINTARGIGSVVGTLFTWPTATALSMGLQVTLL